MRFALLNASRDAAERSRDAPDGAGRFEVLQGVIEHRETQPPAPHGTRIHGRPPDSDRLGPV